MSPLSRFSDLRIEVSDGSIFFIFYALLFELTLFFDRSFLLILSTLYTAWCSYEPWTDFDHKMSIQILHSSTGTQKLYGSYKPYQGSALKSRYVCKIQSKYITDLTTTVA